MSNIINETPPSFYAAYSLKGRDSSHQNYNFDTALLVIQDQSDETSDVNTNTKMSNKYQRHQDAEVTASSVNNEESNRSEVAANSSEMTQLDRDHTSNSRKQYIAVFILFTINLLNYMDRFTVAGTLVKIQKYFHFNDQEGGLLQTVFFGAYMIAAPVFGYIGDRWIRKWIIVGGVTFWSVITLVSSFADNPWLFLFFRGMVGVGEASYSTIAPPMIADLFVNKKRSFALMLFYFAVPVGSGLGYIIGILTTTKEVESWRWSLRITPGFGILCVLLLILFVEEPERGHAEGAISQATEFSWQDFKSTIKSLVKNITYICVNFGFVSVAFVAGALTWWAPKLIVKSLELQNNDMNITEVESGYLKKVDLYFGAITCFAGFAGVAIGSEWARRWRRSNARADSLVCAIGMILCTPFLYASLLISEVSFEITLVLVLFGETSLCLNWTLVTEILLKVIIPTERSLASSGQILIGHFLGDAGSPWLIGLLSDALREGKEATPRVEYFALRRALYTTAFIAVLGGAAFLAASLSFCKDHWIMLEKSRRSVADDVTSRDTLPPYYSERTIPVTMNVHSNDKNSLLDKEVLPDGFTPLPT